MDNKGSYQPASTAIAMQPAEVAVTSPQRDYLGWSICNLLCCCWPLGVASLIYSVKTRDARYYNDSTLEAEHSSKSLKLNIAALVVGLIFAVIYLVVYFVVLQKAQH
ncbi:interferon-induced transmembrane protein 3-like [Gastrophryne carolinensis]